MGIISAPVSGWLVLLISLQLFVANGVYCQSEACPEGTFGDGCTQTCDCSGQHVQSCDHVDGTCYWEPDWEGSSCDDEVDECASDNLNDCSDTDHTVCQNTDGGFTCVCQEGYKKDSNDVCIDIDECSAGIHRCSHTCKNTDGGFTCSCPPGMMLDNDNKTCVTCHEGTFGDGCTQTCDCPGQHVQSCDHVDGTCRCKAGWEGSSCEEDIDECASDNLNDCSDTAHTVCQNTDGGFTCVCQEGFKTDSNDVCIAVSRLPFTVVIQVTLPTADLSSEQSRSAIQREVQDMIFNLLKRFVDHLMAVEVRSLRAGSVIVAVDAVVPNDTVRSSAASLSVALLDITGLNVAVAGQTGPVGAVVGDATVSANTTVCDVFTNYVTCEDSQTCQVTNNVPDCRDQVLGDEKLLALVIGLAVGIPCFIVIVCIVVALCYRHSKSKRRMEYEENNQGWAVDANKFSHPHPLDAPEGNVSFPLACRMHEHQ